MDFFLKRVDFSVSARGVRKKAFGLSHSFIILLINRLYIHRLFFPVTKRIFIIAQ